MKKLLASEQLSETIRQVGWSGRNISDLYTQVVRVLSGNSDAASLLAEPIKNTDATEIDYYADDYQDKIRYVDMRDDKDKEAFKQRLETAVQHIEQTIADLQQKDETATSNLANAMQAIFIIPSKEFIYCLDGRPVVAFWGYGGSLQAFDIRNIRGKVPPPPIPWYKKWWAWSLFLLLPVGLFSVYYLYDNYWRNHAPQAVADIVTLAAERTSITVDILSNDSDPNENDNLSIKSCDDTARLTVTDSTVTYQRQAGKFGKQLFNCTIQDSSGLTDTAALIIDVEKRKPQAVADKVRMPANQNQIPIDILANDQSPEGDSLSIKSCQPSLPIRGNKVIYTRKAGVTGAQVFTCTIQDSDGLSDAAKLTVDIKYRGPTAVADEVTLNAGDQSITHNLTKNDIKPENQTIRLISCDNSPQLQIVSKSSVTYTRKDNITGEQVFTCTIKDDKGFSDSATLTVNVTRRRPTARPDKGTLSQLQDAVSIPVLANDFSPEGDSLRIASCNGLTIDGDKAIYQRQTNVTGVVTLNCTIADSQGLTATANVSIDVSEKLDCTPQRIEEFSGRYGAPEIMLVVDKSSSMNLKDNEVNSRWDYAVNSIGQLFTVAHPNIDFGLFTLDKKKLYRITGNSRSDMLRNIGGAKGYSPIAYHLAFNKLRKQLENIPNKRFIFVLITDAEYANNKPTAEQIQMVKEIENQFGDRVTMNVIRLVADNKGRQYSVFTTTNGGYNITLDSIADLSAELQKTVNMVKPAGCP